MDYNENNNGLGGFDNQNPSNDGGYSVSSPTENYSAYGDTLADPVGASVVTKRSFKKVPIIIAAALVVIIAATSLCYAFVPTVKNFIRKNTMSPQKYFQVVQKEGFEETAKTYADQYGAFLDAIGGDLNMKISAGVELTPEFMATDEELSSDMFGETGLKMSGDIQLVAQKEVVSIILSAMMNDIDFHSLNAVVDSEGAYIQYPYLSESWLGMSMDDILYEMGYDSIDELLDETGAAEALEQLENFDPEKYLTPAELETLLNKYNNLFINAFEEVEIDKSKEEEIGGVTQKFAVTTATMSDKEFKNFLIDVLEELADEDFMVDIINDLNIEGLDKAAFKAGIEYVITFVEDSWDDLGLDFDITLQTYVDSKGALAGNIITVSLDVDGESGDIEVSALQAKDGDTVGVEGGLKIKAADIGSYYPLTYKGKLSYNKDNLATGTIDISIVDAPDEEYGEEYTIPVKLKDFGYVEKDGQQWVVGEISVTIEDAITDAGDFEIVMNFAYNNGASIECTLNVDDVKYMSFNFGYEYDAAEKLDVPSAWMTDTEEYVGTIDMDKLNEFMAVLEEAFPSTGYDDYDDYYYDDYDEYSTGSTYEDGYNEGWSAGYLDAQYYDMYDNYDSSWGENEDYELGYDDGYEDGYADGLAEISDTGNITATGDGIWGGYEQGAYYGKQVGERDAYLGLSVGANYYDSEGEDPDYDEGYSFGYSEGYNKYSNANGISYDISKPVVTNPIYNINKGSVSTEPLVTTAENSSTENTVTSTVTTVTVADGTEYKSSSHGVKVQVPNGYNVSEESGAIEISNQNNLISIESKYNFKYSSVKAIADLYSAAGMVITSQNENFSLSGLKGFKVDFTADGTKGFVVYVTQGTNAPYAVTSNGNDTAVLESILNSIIIE